MEVKTVRNNLTQSNVATIIQDDNLLVSGVRAGSSIKREETTYEIVDEFPFGGFSQHAQFVQVVEPSSPVVINYLAGPNGTLIPVLDTLPVDNFLTFLSTEKCESDEPGVPSHILDHMYAKKRKDPTKEKKSRPKRRRRQELPTVQFPTEYILTQSPPAELGVPSTTKVNIIRKGMVCQSPNVRLRPELTASKSITKAHFPSSQRKLGNKLTLKSKHPPQTIQYLSDDSVETRSESSGGSKIPEIFFIPSAESQLMNKHKLPKTTTIPTAVTFTTASFSDGTVEQMCLMDGVDRHQSNSKTDLPNDTASVATFRLNPDGSISPVSPTDCTAENQSEDNMQLINSDQVQYQYHDGQLFTSFQSDQSNKIGSKSETVKLQDKNIFYLYE